MRIIICTIVLGFLGMASIIAAQTSGENQALHLDGTSGLVQVTYGKGEAVVDNFTVSFWVKPESNIYIPQESRKNVGPPKDQKYLLKDDWAGSEGSPTSIVLSVGNNGIALYEKGFHYSATMLGHRADFSGWNHITLVYTNKQPTLYVNSQLVGRGLQSKARHVQYIPFFIGGTERSEKFSGVIDDFSLWNRALSYQEIAAIYRSMEIDPADGPVLYFNFDEMFPDGTIDDNSGNGHTGMLVGSASVESVPHAISIRDQAAIQTNSSESDVDSIEVSALSPLSEGIAVIIGIEDYRNAPKATFAARDAKTFEKYAAQTLGIPQQNIYTISNEQATLAEFMKLFNKNGFLKRRSSAQSDIFVYYSGHGAPDFNTNIPYLIPYDVDPDYPSTGYSTRELYENLGELDVHSITVFLDACFSGATRNNEMLLENARPVLVKWNYSAIPKNVTVFSASSGAQISSGYPEKGHGLFSYFLMKGLSGQSDTNQDHEVSLHELYDYVSSNVSKTAGTLDREQTPELINGNDDRVICRFSIE